MLIAEDLLLLLTDDESGKPAVSGPEVDAALAGALLIELTLMKRLDLAGPDDGGKQGRLVLRDGSPTQDPVLDDALARLTKYEGKRPSAAIGPLSKDVRGRLYERLVDRGILRSQQGRILGIFPNKTWPTEELEHERAVREYVVTLLRGGQAGDPRIAALVSLLHALGSVHKVIDLRAAGLDKKQAVARAKEIAAGDWPSRAVRKALDDMAAM